MAEYTNTGNNALAPSRRCCGGHEHVPLKGGAPTQLTEEQVGHLNTLPPRWLTAEEDAELRAAITTLGSGLHGAAEDPGRAARANTAFPPPSCPRPSAGA